MRWDRIEALGRAVEFDEGVRARIADPLWMLARQWQLGELTGDDAAQPSAVRVRAGSTPVSSVWPTNAAAPRALDGSTPLEAEIEAAPRARHGISGFRESAAAGAVLQRMLRHARLGTLARGLPDAFPLTPPQGLPALGNADTAMVDLLTRRGCDGLAIYGPSNALEDFVESLSADDAPKFLRVRTAWMESYGEGSDDAWVPSRLEHRFTVAAPGPQRDIVLSADEHAGGHLDWYSFDYDASTTHELRPTPADEHERSMIPTPVMFHGMPASRWWEFEDGEVSLGDLNAGPADMARLAVAEFATVYSDDWFVIPLRLKRGTLSRVSRLRVFDTMGGHQDIDPASLVDARRTPARPWRFFELTGDPHVAEERSPWMFLPPTVGAMVSGPALERVVFARDEGANLAWGIERLVEGPRGRSLDRAEAWAARLGDEAPTQDPDAPSRRYDDQEWRYIFETTPPPWWVPFVAERLDEDTAEVRLRRARMRTWEELDPEDVGPKGTLIGRRAPFAVYEEEVPRSGITVDRSWQYTRWHDGSGHRWLQRRKQNGRGERSSGLRWDALEDT